MQRLRDRDPHLTEEDASNRVLSQGDVRDKARRSLARGSGRGVVVWNDGDREQLRRDVDKAMMEIKAKSPPWWAMLCLLCPPIGASSAAWALFRNWSVDRAWRKQEQIERAKL
jgi:dephospho-CoA kinase